MTSKDSPLSFRNSAEITTFFPHEKENESIVWAGQLY